MNSILVFPYQQMEEKSLRHVLFKNSFFWKTSAVDLFVSFWPVAYREGRIVFLLFYNILFFFIAYAHKFLIVIWQITNFFKKSDLLVSI